MPKIPGWATVPPKLLKKIWSLDFIDMWELLPESWRLDQQAEGCCRSQRPKRGLVTNLALWTECYAVLVAILSDRYPSKTPHFMAYLRTITRASRNFEGVAWATYDMAYRRQAATRRSLDWAVSDTALYNEAFTGRAKLIRRCIYCLADSHESKDCAFAPEESAPTPRPSRHPHPAPPGPHIQPALGQERGWSRCVCCSTSRQGASVGSSYVVTPISVLSVVVGATQLQSANPSSRRHSGIGRGPRVGGLLVRYPCWVPGTGETRSTVYAMTLVVY